MSQLQEYIEYGEKSNEFIYYRGLITYIPEGENEIDLDDYPKLKQRLIDNEDEVDDTLNIYELKHPTDDYGYVGMFVGELHAIRTLVLFGDVDKQTNEMSISNREIKKLAKFLGTDKIRFQRSEDTDGEQNSEFEFVDFDHPWYHGTSLPRFINMLKSGGIKQHQEKNFHASNNNYIFLSASVTKAKYYSHNTSGFPCIIVIDEIPDKSKVVMDYDKSRQSPNGDHSGEFERSYQSDSSGGRTMSSERILDTGVIGYKGRIPKSKFSYFMAPEITLEMEFQLEDGSTDDHQFSTDDYKRFRSLNEYKSKCISIITDEMEMELSNNDPDSGQFGFSYDQIEGFQEGEIDLSDELHEYAENLFYKVIHEWE